MSGWKWFYIPLITKDSGLKVNDTSFLTKSVLSMSKCPALPLVVFRAGGRIELVDVGDIAISSSGFLWQLSLSTET